MLLWSVAGGAQQLDLTDTSWRVQLGDQPEWAQPDYDDTAWPSAAMPDVFAGFPVAVSEYGTVGWARARFELPPSLQMPSLALYLGPVLEAATVYLNGHKLMDIGHPRPRIDRAYAAAPRYPQAVLLPAESLIADGENTLVLRFQSVWSRLGVELGPVYIGPAQHVATRVNTVAAAYTLAEAAILGAAVIIAVLLLGADWARGRPLAHGLLIGGLVLAMLSILMSYSAVGHVLGLVRPGSYLLSYLPAWLGISALYLHVARLGKQRLHRFDLGLALLTAIGAVVEQLLPADVLLLVDQYLFVLFIVMVLRIGWLARAAIKQGVEGALTVAVLALLGVMLTLNYLGISLLPPPLSLFDAEIMLVVWLLVTLFAVARRYLQRLMERERLAVSLLKSQERERRRIANDLHDGIGQRLAALNWQLDGDVDTHALSAQLQDTMEDLRHVVRGLRPELLDQMGLAGALRWLADGLRQGNADLTITVRAEALDIPDDVAAQLFRIAQEACNNALRHGRARRIDIQLQTGQGQWHLGVTDNGKGFDRRSGSGHSGLGLTAMYERARACEGRLTIDSRPGQGTRVQVRVPCRA